MENLNPADFFFKIIKNKPTVPRWIIFLLDLCFCAFSMFLAYLLRFNLDFEKVAHSGYLASTLIVTGINIIFFKIFRTSEGIIRLSNAQEGLRCVSAIFCSSLVFLIANAVGAVFQLAFIVPTSVLFIYFFTSSFLIFSYRLLIKELYNRSLKLKLTSVNVIVFGKAENAGLLKNAIESIAGQQYKVVAFVDGNENLWGKSIDNAKIYSWQQTKVLALKLNIKYFFLASEEMGIELKNEIVDYCLVRNINMKVIPAVQKWLDGQLQIRQIKDLKIEDLLNRPSIKLASEHVKMYLTGKKVLITGAAGSIGSEIVKQLAGIQVHRHKHIKRLGIIRITDHGW